MNQRLYRIVFNRARGLLMVAAETASARHGGGERGERCLSPRRLTARLSTLTLAVMLASGTLSLNVWAEVREDMNAPGNQRPTVMTSANGTPQVDIQSPNAQGVSHNQYRQFDVGPEGVILNNSRRPTATQQGGYVDGNPWLARGEAQVILNEVNARDPSKLNGWIEVAGQRADVIVANPAGITCDGCGFINADRGVLSTGQPIMENGQLKGFDVERGALTVDGKGLDARGTRHTDLIARTVQLNADVHAQELSVTTGRNRVDTTQPGQTQAQAKAENGGDKPKVALDVAALGGMYAQRIQLVGTEQGVGVHNAGSIGASAGEITLNAAGQVDNRGTISAHDNVRVAAAQTLGNAGRIVSNQAITLTTPDEVRNSGVIAAGHDTTVQAGQVTSSEGSALAAGVDGQGKLTQAGQLSVTSQGNLTARGQSLATDRVNLRGEQIDLQQGQVAARDIQLDARKGLDSSHATVAAQQALAVHAEQPVVNRAGQWAAEQVIFTAPALDNSDGVLQNRGAGALDLDVQRLDNSRGTVMNAGERLTITAPVLTNAGGTIAQQGRDLTLRSDQFDNTGGRVQHSGDGALHITTQTLQGRDGTVVGNGTLSLTGSQLVMDGATTAAQRIALDATQLSHRNGVMVQRGSDEMRLNLAEQLDNSAGQIESNGALNVTSPRLDNSGGRLLAAKQGALNINAVTALDNRAGQLLAGGALHATTQGTLGNQAGTISGGRATQLQTQQLDNTQGRVQSRENALTLDATRIDNTNGQLQAAHSITLHADQVQQDGRLIAGQDVQAQVGDWQANAHSVTAAGVSPDGQLTQPGSITVEAQRTLAQHGQQLAHDALALSAPTLDLSGSQLQADHQQLTARDGALTTDNAILVAAHTLDARTPAQISNRQGQWQAEQFQLTTPRLDNTNGLLHQSGGDALRLDLATFDNLRGTLRSGARETQLTAQQLDNTQGVIDVRGDQLRLTTPQLTNTDGHIQLSGAGPLMLQSDRMNGDRGTVAANGLLTLYARDMRLNQAATVADQIDLTADTLAHHGGTLVQRGQDTLRVHVKDTLDNTQGVIESRGDIDLSAATFTQRDGRLLSADGHNATVRSTTLDNTQGQLAAGRALNVTTDTLDNTRGTLLAGDQLTVNADRVDNGDGRLTAGQMKVTSGQLDNRAGLIHAREALDLTGNTLTNRDSGTQSGIISQGRLNANVDTLTQDAGVMLAQGDLTLNTTQLTNDAGSRIGSVAGRANLTVHDVLTNAGQVQAGDALVLKAGMLSHSGTFTVGHNFDAHADTVNVTTDAVIAAGVDSDGQLNQPGQLSLTGNTLNAHGRLLAHDQVSVQGDALNLDQARVAGQHVMLAAAKRLSTQDAQITAQQQVHGQAGEAIDNTRGQWAAEQLILTTPVLDNTQGTLLIRGLAPFEWTGTQFTNRQGRLITQSRETRLNADHLDNTQGLIAANGERLAVTAQQLDNRDGTVQLAGSGPFILKADQLDGTQGKLLARGQLAIDGQRLTLDQATTAADQITLNADTLSHRGGALVQQGTHAPMQLTAHKAFDNTGGMAASAGDLSLTAGQFDNTDGQLRAGDQGRLDVTATQAITNTRGRVDAGRDVQLTGTALENTDGRVVAGNALDLTLSEGLKNTHGVIAGQALTLDTQAPLDNRTGLLSSASTLTLDTHGAALDNRDSGTQGGIIAQGPLRLSSGDLDNRQGVIVGRDAVDLSTATFTNAQGTLIAQKQAQLATEALDNTAGLLQSNAQLTLDTHGQQLTNRDSGEQGGILGREGVKLTTGTLDNTHGVIHGAQTRVDTQDHDLSNAQGQLVGRDQLDVYSGALNNTAGLLQSNAQLTLDTRGQQLTNRDSGDEGGISGRELTLRTGNLDNTRGVVVGERATLATQQLTNANGQIATRQSDLALTTTGVENTQGLLQSAAQLTLDTQGGRLENHGQDAGQGIIAQGPLTVHSGALSNQQGRLSSGETLTLTAQDVNNRQGQLGSAKDAELATHTFDNTRGLLQSGGALHLNTQGMALTNVESGTQAGIIAQGPLTLATGALDNSTGFIASQAQTRIDSGVLNNAQGMIAGNQGLNIDSQALDNRAGHLQTPSTLTLDTHGQPLTNAQGQLTGEQALHLLSGALDNTAGQLGSRDSVRLDTHGQTLTNAQGQISAGRDLTVNSGALLNTDGQMQAVNTATLNTTTLDNTHGLLRAGTLNITAPQLTNRDTRDDAHGIEAAALTLNGARLDNTGGAIRGRDQITLAPHDTLDNTHGLISSQNALAINGPLDALTVTNTNGTIIAGQSLRLQGHALKGAGQLLSQQDLALNLGQDLTVDGDIIANRHLDLRTAGTLTNRHVLKAGDTLAIHANTLENQATGEIASPQTTISAGQLTNRGLIDGTLTTIDANQLDNLGTGRIYGDQLAIRAGNLNNLNENDAAPVIAARERLDLGMNTLTNRDHGLIYSQGDMAIKSGLDAQHRATGQAERIDNLSATIESMGNLEISAKQINNRDLHLELGPMAEVSRTFVHEFQAKNQKNRYPRDQVVLTINARPIAETPTNGNAKKDTLSIRTPEGSHDHFTDFKYDRVEYRSTVQHQDPGTIVSGGNLRLQDGTLTNENSKVTAGKTLSLQNTELNNQEAVGAIRTTEENGTARFAWSYRNHHWSYKSKLVDFNPRTQETSLPLHLIEFRGDTQPEARAVDMARAGRGEVSASLAPVGNVTPRDAQGRVTTPAMTQAALAEIDTRTVASRDNTTVTGPEVRRPDGSRIQLDVQAVGAQTQGVDTHVTGAIGSLGQLPSDTLFEVDAVNVAPLPEAKTPAAQQAGTALSENVPAQVNAQAAEAIVRSVVPHTTLPDNSLFTIQPDSQSRYLVETDPRFTQYKQWLGTDYMQSQLRNRPDALEKRLGDGFYEQRLVREQVMQLTGQRYLAGQHSDESQLKALMDAGIAFGNQHNLQAGVALSPEQMALLTSDIVWLVNKSVTLADGTQQTVSVPQVYARLHKGDLTGQGALLSGNNVVTSGADITNSGVIAGRELMQLSVNDLLNSGLISSGQVDVAARGNIQNIGGQVEGRDRVSLRAGGDIDSRSTQRGDDANRYLDRQAGIYVENDKGVLALQALNNIDLAATDVINTGRDGQTLLSAGHDLNLNTLSNRFTDNSGTLGSDNYSHYHTATDIGSQVIGKGDVTLAAGNDLNTRAASLLSDQQLTLQAGRDLNLNAGEATSDFSYKRTERSKGFLSSETRVQAKEEHDRTALGTALSADTIDLRAGRDLTVQAGNIVGTHDVDLAAGRDLNVTTTAERQDHQSMQQTTKSGLLSSGGIGFTIGKQLQSTENEHVGDLNKGSTIGSSEGNTRLVAGNDVNVHGSDVIAGQDLALQGKNVTVDAANNNYTDIQKTEFKQSGLTLALSGTVGSAINAAVETTQDARKNEDGRMQALQGTQAALKGVQAYQASDLAGAKAGSPDGSQDNVFAVTASLGQQKSSSESRQDQTTAQGSTLGAGRDLSITATGNGEAGQGDINVQGSQLKAARDVALNAAHDLNLTSSENTSRLSGSNKSSGGSIGVSVGTNGVTLNLSANQGKGRERGDGVTHNETQVDAGRTVSLNVGNNALLRGAQVNGEKIVADIAHNLTLQSEQDHDHYDSKQQNVSGGLSIPIAGAGAASGSMNMSRTAMNSDYDSVQAQTGLFAGKGGFDVKVGDHTQLNGAALSSTADADKNRLDTGTLGFSDIANHAEYKVDQQSTGISSGAGSMGDLGKQLGMNMAATTLTNLNGGDSASSTTHAAVSDGLINIRDQANQQQDVATLSRDTEHANNALTPIFDKEKEQQRLARMQAVSDIGSQAMDIVRTQGQINAHKAAQEQVQAQEANNKLNGSDKQAVQAAYDHAYNQQMLKYGTGSSLQQGIQAATGALTALAGGDVKQAIAQGAAPYLAEQVKKATEGNTAANTIGHALVGGVVAELSGQNAAAGATGAAAGELAARAIASNMFNGKNISELSESERRQVSDLSTLAAGLAGGVAGNSTASTVAGAKAGQNAVENNWLNSSQAVAFDKEMTACKQSGNNCASVINKFKVLSDKQRAETDEKLKRGETGVVQVFDRELADGGLSTAKSAEWLGYIPGVNVMYDDTAKAAVQQWNQQDINYMAANTPTWVKVLDTASDPESIAVLAVFGTRSATVVAADGVTGVIGAGLQKIPTGKGAVIGGTASGVVNVGAQYAKEGDISKVDWWETLVSTVTGYGTAYSSIPTLMTVNGLSTVGLKYAEGAENPAVEGLVSAGSSLIGNVLGGKIVEPILAKRAMSKPSSILYENSIGKTLNNYGINKFEENKFIIGIMKKPESALQNTVGNVIDSSSSEWSSNYLMNEYENSQKKGKENDKK